MSHKDYILLAAADGARTQGYVGRAGVQVTARDGSAPTDRRVCLYCGGVTTIKSPVARIIVPGTTPTTIHAHRTCRAEATR